MFTLNESNRIGYYEIEFELDGIELEGGHPVQCNACVSKYRISWPTHQAE